MSCRSLASTCPETMKITLRKESGNFGLGISDKVEFELPVIESIQPNSPAHRAGVLKLGDRILAINGISVSAFSCREFSILKREAFYSHKITLTVEFDVYDEEILFGEFDVVLDRSLKIGLEFKDVQKGFPLTVSGIVRGSAAHRCGEVFVGDEVLMCKHAKSEDSNSLTGEHIQQENIIFTVFRDIEKGLKDKPHNPSPYSRHEGNRSQGGKAFRVRKTAVYSSPKEIAVDHEVTLYRDSSSCDFGIHFGKDPSTGRACIGDIRPDGPADKAGVIRKFDRIIKVNGVLVDKNVENHVLELFSNADREIDLHIRRINRL